MNELEDYKNNPLKFAEYYYRRKEMKVTTILNKMMKLRDQHRAKTKKDFDYWLLGRDAYWAVADQWWNHQPILDIKDELLQAFGIVIFTGDVSVPLNYIGYVDSRVK